MSDHPILFSGEMVRAILDGRKTQTRRVIRPQPCQSEYEPTLLTYWTGKKHPVHHSAFLETFYKLCLYGQPGDRLWARETWRYFDWTEDGYPRVEYAADGAKKWHKSIPDSWGDRLAEIWAELSESDNYDRYRRAADQKWRPSIYMPKWAARLWLAITDIRVERVQEISDYDCCMEGVHVRSSDGAELRNDFAELWDSINAKRGYSWESNPWVWVIEFRRIGK